MPDAAEPSGAFSGVGTPGAPECRPAGRFSAGAALAEVCAAGVIAASFRRGSWTAGAGEAGATPAAATLVAGADVAGAVEVADAGGLQRAAGRATTVAEGVIGVEGTGSSVLPPAPALNVVTVLPRGVIVCPTTPVAGGMGARTGGIAATAGVTIGATVVSRTAAVIGATAVVASRTTAARADVVSTTVVAT